MIDLENLSERQSGETLVILQRFRADDLFNHEQKERLRDLMDQYHAAIAQGIKLDDNLQTELENLVEAEMEATIQRSKRLLSNQHVLQSV